MKHIHFNGQDYAVPFASLVRRHTPQEFANLEVEVLAEGELLEPIQSYVDPDCGLSILDGEHRAIICEKHDIEPWVMDRGPMTRKKAEKRCLRKNYARRHLTPAEQMEAQRKAKGERMPKVMQARLEGKSTRAIAAEVGVTQTQVLRDLADAERSGETGVSPDAALPPVVGRDGKTYTPPKRKAKRKSVPERMIEAALAYGKLLKRYTTGKGNESNRQRVIAHSATLDIPLTDDGTKCPWLGLLAILGRELS